MTADEGGFCSLVAARQVRICNERLFIRFLQVRLMRLRVKGRTT